MLPRFDRPVDCRCLGALGSMCIVVACTNSGGGSGPANSPAEAPSTFPSPVTSTVMSSRLPSEPFDGVESCKDAQADTASDESIASSSDEETWTDNHRSVDSCEDYRVARWAEVYEDPHGPKRVFGYDGYLFRRVAIRRTIGGEQRTHCVRVYHPRERSREGKKVRVSEWIGPSWYRLIENSLNRLPWHHLQVVHAFVIDDRPILHGVASFSREDPSHDARDGHTIWLNKRLFLEPNGWGPGNYGKYWAYRVNRDGQRAHGQVPEHDLFSPVLLHEVGHLVNYSVVNGSAADPSCPPCAYMCGDHKNCAELKPAQREAFCVTSYCTGFGYASGTENFAEMYRWFYQGRETRELLEQHFEPCHRLLESSNGAWKAPWDNGMGEISSYRKTLWDSCDGTACRAW